MKNVIAVIFTLLLSYSAAANAITLTDPATGLSLTAPAGYTLSSSGGVYTLRGKKSTARFITGRSALSLAPTVDSFIKQAKVKNVNKKKKGSTEFDISGKLGSRAVIVKFTAKGGFINVVTFYKNSKIKSAKTEKASLHTLAATEVTIPEIAALQKAINSRRGGLAVPINVQIPVKRFTAPDGGSSAIVPELPGWSYQGGGGIIAGANPTQGIVSLGVPVLVSFSFWPSATPPISDNVTAAEFVNVWPQYVKATTGVQIQILSAQEIPGTRGWLGAGTDSALFGVRFNLNGQAWQALFLSSAAFIPDAAFGWYWYHSYIAVPENGPGGIAPALLNTWASWDNSGASQARLRDALNTLLSIRVSGAGPIDPDVFQEAANAWDEYIQQ